MCWWEETRTVVENGVFFNQRSVSLELDIFLQHLGSGSSRDGAPRGSPCHLLLGCIQALERDCNGDQKGPASLREGSGCVRRGMVGGHRPSYRLRERAHCIFRWMRDLFCRMTLSLMALSPWPTPADGLTSDSQLSKSCYL